MPSLSETKTGPESALSDGGPAFPNPGYGGMRGMSLRQWYAGQALAGLCANPGGPFQANSMQGWGMANCDEHTVAQTAVTLADALLAELVDRVETVRS